MVAIMVAISGIGNLIQRSMVDLHAPMAIASAALALSPLSASAAALDCDAKWVCRPGAARAVDEAESIIVPRALLLLLAAPAASRSGGGGGGGGGIIFEEDAIGLGAEGATLDTAPTLLSSAGRRRGGLGSGL